MTRLTLALLCALSLALGGCWGDDSHDDSDTTECRVIPGPNTVAGSTPTIRCNTHGGQ